MTATVTLNSIASDIVGHYSRAARGLVGAYRTGSERAIEFSGERYAQIVEKIQLPLVTEEGKARIVAAERRVADVVSKGVSRISSGLERAIDAVTERTNKNIESFAEQTEWTKDMFVVNAVRQVNMPGAKLQLEIASRIEDAVQQLSERVAGEPVAPVATKPATKRVAKRRAGRA
jgi:hypothetical protein